MRAATAVRVQPGGQSRGGAEERAIRQPGLGVWGACVDEPDPGPAQLAGRGLVERGQSRLRRRVAGHPRHRGLGHHCADVHDEGRPATRCGGLQVGKCCAQQADRREGVEREEVDDHLVRSLGRRPEGDSPRGEHHTVEPAVPLDRLGHDLLGGARPTQVGRHGECLQAEGGQPVGVAAAEGQPGACRREPTTQWCTQPPGRPGDEDAGACQRGHARQPATQRLRRHRERRWSPLHRRRRHPEGSPGLLGQ